VENACKERIVRVKKAQQTSVSFLVRFYFLKTKYISHKELGQTMIEHQRKQNWSNFISVILEDNKVKKP
jgi:hypothetical protein